MALKWAKDAEKSSPYVKIRHADGEEPTLARSKTARLMRHHIQPGTDLALWQG
jgi:hypothetical protein